MATFGGNQIGNLAFGNRPFWQLSVLTALVTTGQVRTSFALVGVNRKYELWVCASWGRQLLAWLDQFELDPRLIQTSSHNSCFKAPVTRHSCFKAKVNI